MFVVLVRYVRPLEVIDSLLEEHREFLGRYLSSGVFLAAGRREPRTGGLILARGEDEKVLREILREDPFHREGAAEYDLIRFTPTLTVPEWEATFR